MLPETASEEVPAPRRRFLAGFPALRHRNFRLFVVGQGLSLIGFWMQSVAQGWLVYRLREQPLDLARSHSPATSRSSSSRRSRA